MLLMTTVKVHSANNTSQLAVRCDKGAKRYQSPKFQIRLHTRSHSAWPWCYTNHSL